MNDGSDTPPPDVPSPNVIAVAAAAGGAAVAVGFWALLARSVDFPTSFLALAVGAAAGGVSRVLGGRGPRVAAAAAGLTLVGAFLGNGFAAGTKVVADVRNELASVDRAHYDSFAAAAADWRPDMPADEVPKFARRHEFVQFGSGVEARVAEFKRTVVPKLESWKKSPPTFEAWKASRSAEIRAGEASRWGKYLASPLDYLSPLDLLFALVAVGAAGWIANVPEPVKIVRRARRESGPTPSGPG